jgi:hypothetical protein
MSHATLFRGLCDALRLKVSYVGWATQVGALEGGDKSVIILFIILKYTKLHCKTSTLSRILFELVIIKYYAVCSPTLATLA